MYAINRYSFLYAINRANDYNMYRSRLIENKLE